MVFCYSWDPQRWSLTHISGFKPALFSIRDVFFQLSGLGGICSSSWFLEIHFRDQSFSGTCWINFWVKGNWGNAFHVWYVHLYNWLISIVNVGKYTSQPWMVWDTYFNQHILRKFLPGIHIGTCVSMVGKDVTRVSSNELLRFGTSWWCIPEN